MTKNSGDDKEPKRLRTTSDLIKARGDVPITKDTWLSLAEFREVYPRRDAE